MFLLSSFTALTYDMQNVKATSLTVAIPSARPLTSMASRLGSTTATTLTSPSLVLSQAICKYKSAMTGMMA